MQRSFSYIVLITWFLLAWSCKTQYVTTSLKKSNHEVVNAAVPLDSQLVSIYLPYKSVLEKDMSRVISVSEQEMVKDRPESSLTNFLADMMLKEGAEIAAGLNKDIRPDISFLNYGGIRTFLPRGEITVHNIFELMPFENEVVFIQLSGEQVQEFLNYVAENGGNSVGGIRFKISENKAANVEIGGKPLSEKELYWLVTNDYVAAGGDGFDVFTRRKEFVAGNVKIRDVIIAHLEKELDNGRQISAKPDGRIVYE
ncbi:5'-nucleotidase, C-terminal domain [Mariniphaga anaerophila]|uniref:5'-nucleotidase, C-terminal domain n=1 Tax=Mariniphaga anaerophila TaxID=1484053 RepID=A0A1M5APC3_9BACT|nr:5'-nucleotidase [Mariniphaga anaerophila]SHF32014.1 5'-nucleotidase, C-terminal domain [Mariniphaga anaerophila]